MAKRDDAGRAQMAKPLAQQQQQNQDQEKEEAAPEVDGPESEQSRLQNTVGNQGVAAMIASGAADGGGGAGIEMEAQVRSRRSDKEAKVEHGGDDVADDGILTIEELTESWNPGTRRSDDREKFREPMPDDDLPPEDEAWLDAIRSWPDPLPIPPAWTVDGLLQPTDAVVCASLADWAIGLAGWASPDPAWRAAAMLLRPPAGLLQDPEGRVLISRARGAAIGTWILLDSPAFAHGASIPTASFVDLCLEMEGRRHRLVAVRVATELSGKKIPIATEVFAEHHPDPPTRIRANALPSGAHAWLLRVLDALLDLDDPLALVPDLSLPDEVDEAEEDPLGLDEVMRALTGGPTDREDALYKSAVQAAERLAAACARARVRGAALAVVLGEAARVWSSGSPTDNLHDTLAALDRDVAAVLQLLVEIARAAQKKQVAPRGLRTGLQRAARQLAAAIVAYKDALSGIVGGILPGSPELPLPQAAPLDPLEHARLDGHPSEALPWLARRGDDLLAQAAYLFAQVAAGVPTARVAPGLASLRRRAEQEDDIGIYGIASVLHGAACLRLGDTHGALQVAEAQLELGRERRNGVLIAEAALLAVEAHRARGDEAAADVARGRSANLLWRLGASGGLSLLARWTPPTVEADDTAGAEADA